MSIARNADALDNVMDIRNEDDSFVKFYMVLQLQSM
jgi:hypothetical protein